MIIKDLIRKTVMLMCVVMTCLFASCAGYNRNEDGAITYTDDGNLCFKLVPVEFRGETHEYLFYCAGYAGSYSHWEGCKYCKKQKNESETIFND